MITYAYGDYIPNLGCLWWTGVESSRYAPLVTNVTANYQFIIKLSSHHITRANKKTATFVVVFVWWTGVDSNHRKRSWQIYSLLPLATREPVHIEVE